ncbi:acyl-CoA thioesterase [Aspergillus mulundensis]|uniref:Thioesterase n=1 Tax=Aspergillus mulundensis TaxID=1810919 RepID=A0A3D8QZI5_9EURO|nr:hypothetical protein DSM5745_09082 [Aspergillus mulundensis]RDW67216.1 hypothetical protein DSM5745_09082 [Aspergillus mulundensis]
MHVNSGWSWGSLSYTESAVLVAFIVLLLVNLKGVVGVWHVRLFKGLCTQYILAARERTSTSKAEQQAKTNFNGPRNDPSKPTPAAPKNPPRLTSYLVTTHRNAPIDCDYNMHKSNSTFFADLDINRAQLLLRLFGGFPRWAPAPATPTGTSSQSSKGGRSKETERSLNVALGGVSCVFKREIKPFQRFEIWSRVLGWDGKWVFVASYFVKAGIRVSGRGSDGGLDWSKDILATSLSRYVFKDGRVTVRPVDVLRFNGLLEGVADGGAEGFGEEIKGAGLFDGLDALPGLFEPGRFGVLGRYSDL